MKSAALTAERLRQLLSYDAETGEFTRLVCEGGTVTEAAKAIGVTASAVTQWPDELPPRIVDRVQAALWRMSQAADAQPTPEPTQQEA